MEEEIFKNIIGYEGLYAVTKDGRVWSYPKKQGKDMYLSVGKFLSPSLSSGYARVTLSRDNMTKTILLHRLVATAFIPNLYNKRTVNHIDGNKLNNSVDNLEWATHSENHKHAFSTGLMKISDRCKQVGKENLKKAFLQNRKLSIEDASEICEAYATGIFTQEELSIPFGVSRKTISNLVRGASYVA